MKCSASLLQIYNFFLLKANNVKNGNTEKAALLSKRHTTVHLSHSSIISHSYLLTLRREMLADVRPHVMATVLLIQA
ncbi:hypothetical protein IMSAGC014_00338 [Bacteroidaceae bacterium]|nr:hypothetical protein IMSAGC014_00338 [Bacteroidaceae bacterium]